jgi:hypothetical protein
MMPNAHFVRQARDRYDACVSKARLSDLWGRITGGATDLVRFQDVAQRLHARQQRPRGIQSVPLERIVGSVGRTHDFTRGFLPRPCVNRNRWSGIDAALNALVPLPPIELYQIGEVYFVLDGHHRISVALANGVCELEANVVDLMTPVMLTVEDFQRDGWIEKAEKCRTLSTSQCGGDPGRFPAQRGGQIAQAGPTRALLGSTTGEHLVTHVTQSLVSNLPGSSQLPGRLARHAA